MSDKPKNLSQALENLELNELKDAVETQVKENPWAAIGIAGLVFFLIGFLLGSKGRGRD